MTLAQVLGYKEPMESRGCFLFLKKSPTFAQIACLAQLPQIPQFITSIKSFGNDMINVHGAFSLST
jgi:hypothetical protein